jgi:3-deoxy-D-manno-octulosonate 8-phosphate phosphatase (KDO 8-P phosphatase)
VKDASLVNDGQTRLILSDVDGVLTSGGIIFNNQGVELKQFHIRDGLGIRLWQRTGYKFGLITGRSSQIVKLRAAELGIDIVRQGFEQKWPATEEIVQSLGLSLEQVCFIGDDLPDLPVIRRVGLGVAVADAAAEVRAAAHLVTVKPGGQGAVRELIETILKAQDRWGDVVEKYE